MLESVKEDQTGGICIERSKYSDERINQARIRNTRQWLKGTEGYIYSKSIYSEDYSSMLASLNNGAMSNGADSPLLLFGTQGIDRRQASAKEEEMIRWRNSYLHLMSGKVQLLEGSFTLQHYPNQGKMVSTALWVIWGQTLKSDG